MLKGRWLQLSIRCLLFSILSGETSFNKSLPVAHESIDTTKMSFNDIHNKIQRGYDSYKVGKTQIAAEDFKCFSENNK